MRFLAVYRKIPVTVTVNGMRFEKERFYGKLFQKTSGIEKALFACDNGDGKTVF